MKILIINTYDRGGAANSCKRLHYGLLANNIDSKILLRHKQNSWPETFPFTNKQSIHKQFYKWEVLEKVKRFLRKRGFVNYDNREIKRKFLNQRSYNLEMFSFPDSDVDITKSNFYKEADLINLHWVADFLDFSSFFRNNKKPVVWTLHDMNAFSGGDHYEEVFLGIDEHGYPKRREITIREKEIAEENFKLKMKALAGENNLTIVAPSKWLAEEAARSTVFQGKKILHIPNGIEPEIFYPRNKNISREFFKIPKNKKVILFVADSLINNRKGFSFLFRTLEQLKRKDVVLCAVGRNSDQFNNSNIIKLGEIKEEKEMSLAYSAADVFVIPSLMDNLPNTVLESLMCGTPVVGFPVGGIPDMVEEGKNGMLTSEISVNSLLKTINEFLDCMEKFDQTRISEEAVKKYGLQVQANNYIRLFKEILKEKI